MASRLRAGVAACAVMACSAFALSGCITGSEQLFGSDPQKSAVRGEQIVSDGGAIDAHAKGVTGDNVVVAVIDTGIDMDHPDLVASIDSRSWDVGSKSRNAEDDLGHGTSVASVIASSRDGKGVIGIAPEAKILAIKASISGGRFPSSYLRDAVEYANQQGAPIVNLSLAGPNPPGSTLYNAMGRSVASGTLLVVAAGNRGQDEPEYPAAYANAWKGAGQLIAVGSVDANNRISSFSNRAGSMKDNYLVARGEAVPVSSIGGSVQSASGTSFAAPMVSGAAALLKQQSPHLTGRQIADLLLQTATDLGAPGTDSVYGRGLLNIDRALQPFGQSIIPTVSSGGNGIGEAAIDETVIYFDPALARLLVDSEALQQTLMLDAYDRSYAVDLSQRLQVIRRKTVASAWLSRPLSPADTQAVTATTVSGLRLGIRDSQDLTRREAFAFYSATVAGGKTAVEFGQGVSRHLTIADLIASNQAEQHGSLGLAQLAGVDVGHSALVESSVGLSASHSFDSGVSLGVTALSEQSAQAIGGTKTIAALLDDTSDRLVAGQIRYRFSPKYMLSFDVGQLSEAGGLLGNSGSGAFVFGDRQNSQFATIGVTARPTRRFSAFGTLSFGQSASRQVQNSLVSGISRVSSSAFAVGLSYRPRRSVGRNGARSNLTLVASQPVRVERGTLALRVPTERLSDGTIRYDDRSVDLSPSGRQVDVRLLYDLAWGEGKSGSLGQHSRLGLIAGASFQPDHNASAATELFAGIKYQQRF